MTSNPTSTVTFLFTDIENSTQLVSVPKLGMLPNLVISPFYMKRLNPITDLYFRSLATLLTLIFP
jgi:hypothetical protein